MRLIDPSDSIAELTLLVRRAYKALADMGLNYTGSYQDEATTLERIKDSECHVMVEGAILIGTLALRRQSPYYAEKDVWFARPEVAHCGQLAVEPGRQGQGLGSRLMHFAECRASELGATELALDTAERAEHLVRFYMNRGYRFIEFIHHKGKTYRSAVLSKTLPEQHSEGTRGHRPRLQPEKRNLRS